MILGELERGRLLPLVVEPETDKEGTFEGLLEWCRDEKEQIDRYLLERGGILFRGFRVGEVEDFERFARSIEPELSSYLEGTSPRTKIKGSVYTSTEYPAGATIPFHNEKSYAKTFPRRLFFFCKLPPEQDGETPIVDSRTVLARLDPGIRERFEGKGLRYVWNIRGPDGILGKSWQEAFETEDRGQIESYCRENQIELQWKENGGLRLTQYGKALARHPRTRELVWFNQATLWHPALLSESARRVLGRDLEELNHYATFGDGSTISDDDILGIEETARRESVVFKWRQDDLLVLENMLVAHARRPFRGGRRVCVTMA